jgi:hypothetical protein
MVRFELTTYGLRSAPTPNAHELQPGGIVSSLRQGVAQWPLLRYALP